jgi:hypothetical protein
MDYFSQCIIRIWTVKVFFIVTEIEITNFAGLPDDFQNVTTMQKQNAQVKLVSFDC